MIRFFAGVFLCLFLILSVFTKNANAFFDPLSRPNNFNGIHILFPSELEQAAHLVNSSTGEWGYVTIPIQRGDRDMEKWQKFMDDAKKYKLIPIIRLSTEGDWQNTAVWAKPTATDILDFANFLSDLSWPVENRYVIVFNEVNRFDEWGGEVPNPSEYAGLLLYAYDTFKERNKNFYIIMSGMDNAAPNDRIKYMDNFVFLKGMLKQNPDIFKKIDGFASHSYPNPGFAAPPLANKQMGITTYQYEYEYINAHSDRKIPAFITETGWDSQKLGEDLVSEYYKTAYDTIWNKDKDKIVAITPFLLNSQGGSFDVFSFVKAGKQTKYYEANLNMDKVKGQPLLEAVKGIATAKIQKIQNLVVKKKPDNTLARELILDFITVFF